MADAEMMSMDARPAGGFGAPDAAKPGAECPFRPLRRPAQVLADADAKAILAEGDYGCLAVEGDNGYPYAVPMTYVYDAAENRIYFHGAVSGAKSDGLERNSKVCFSVVGRYRVVPEEYTCLYRSAIAFGRTHEVKDREAKISVLMRFVDKYSPGLAAGGRRYADRAVDRVRAYWIDVEDLRGKRSSKDPASAGTGR